MPAFNDPAQRSGAAKSKEEAEGQQACGATRNGAGGSTGEAHATEHGQLVADCPLRCNPVIVHLAHEVAESLPRT